MDPLLMDPPATLLPPPAQPPPAHVAHAANPTPPFPANNSHNHPPYAEMITAAITALKEKNGSSRQAIAKYIEKAYTDLPAKHSALLTHHLKRLKNEGQLVMVKHSYILARSVPFSSSTTTDAPTGNGDASPSSGPKRGPGRPPKLKLNTITSAQPITGPISGPGTESILVSLGLVDGPSSKRGPGRPPKRKSFAGAELVGPAAVKKSRGRPPRPKSVFSGLKRGRGRPARTGPIGFAGVPKARGRPRKDGSVKKRTRGRPPKNLMAIGGGALVAAAGGVGLLPGKRRGRPPKAAAGVVAGGRVKKARQLTGKPLGRPRKNASMSTIQAASAQQLGAYEDLKHKFEYFQSKVKQAVDEVRPHLNNETAGIAFRALQELEDLATRDMSVPINVQVPVQAQEPGLLQN